MLLPTTRGILISFAMVIAILFNSTKACADMIDAVVAVVNNDVILESELNEAIKLHTKNNEIDTSHTRKVRDEVLSFLINEKIIEQRASLFGITCSSDELEAAIKNIIKSNNYSVSSFNKTLENSGTTMDYFRQNLRTQLLKNEIIRKHINPKIIISSEEIKEYYDNNFHIYDGILKYELCSISTEISDPVNLEESVFLLKKTLEILQKLDSGDHFDYISKLYSPIKEIKTEYVGAFPENALSNPIKKSIVSLTVGNNSKIKKTETGFQFFHVKDVFKTEPKSLEMVREEIFETLLSEQISHEFISWLDLAKKQSHIEIF